MAKAAKNYRVNFELLGGEKLNKKINGDLSVIVPGSKFINSPARAGNRVNWMAKYLGLGTNILSAVETTDEAVRLKADRKPKAEGDEKPKAAAKKASTKKAAAAKAPLAKPGAKKASGKKGKKAASVEGDIDFPE